MSISASDPAESGVTTGLGDHPDTRRLIGYYIWGSTLVALVERTPDRGGIAQRAID